MIRDVATNRPEWVSPTGWQPNLLSADLFLAPFSSLFLAPQDAHQGLLPGSLQGGV